MLIFDVPIMMIMLENPKFSAQSLRQTLTIFSSTATTLGKEPAVLGSQNPFQKR
jgi:hypothetical protein